MVLSVPAVLLPLWNYESPPQTLLGSIRLSGSGIEALLAEIAKSEAGSAPTGGADGDGFAELQAFPLSEMADGATWGPVSNAQRCMLVAGVPHPAFASHPVPVKNVHVFVDGRRRNRR